MATRVLVLGAGFGGLELATSLSEALGEEIEVTMIDQGDSFVFGYSKLDVMFGRRSAAEVHIPYSDVRQAGGAAAARDGHRDRSRGAPVTTDQGVHEADFLVVALGADYDIEATPGWPREETSSTRCPAPKGWRDLLPTFTPAGW